MTIETKYNKKQQVWLMKENKVVSGIVEEIHAVVVTTTHVLYVLKGAQINYGAKYEESHLHATKEELIASL